MYKSVGVVFLQITASLKKLPAVSKCLCLHACEIEKGRQERNGDFVGGNESGPKFNFKYWRQNYVKNTGGQQKMLLLLCPS